MRIMIKVSKKSFKKKILVRRIGCRRLVMWMYWWVMGLKLSRKKRNHYKKRRSKNKNQELHKRRKDQNQNHLKRSNKRRNKRSSNYKNHQKAQPQTYSNRQQRKE